MRLADVAQIIEGATLDTLYSSHNLRRQGEGGPHVSTPCEYEASDGFGVSKVYRGSRWNTRKWLVAPSCSAFFVR